MKLLLCMLSVMLLLQAYQLECCLQNERAGLLQLMSYFSSISYPKYVDLFPTWPFRDEKSDCCEWERVKCSPSTGRITDLFLNTTARRDDGSWPLNMTLFYPFQELRTLDLSNNSLGSLVQGEGLGTLKNLLDLDLSLNLGIVHLPDFLWSMSTLRVLDFSGCSITGKLDSRLCRLTNIREVYFPGNQFSSSLPACLWNLTSLQVLDLLDNSFSGNLPSRINLPSLELLSIKDNSFRGKFSFNSLTNHSSLKVLLLSNNSLQVTVEEPLSLSSMQLRVLGLANCNLSIHTKTLQKLLHSQSNLQYIDLSDNFLVGSFPTFLLRNNSDLRLLYMRNNSLTGGLQLPQDGNISLLLLDISSNQLGGEIPPHIGTTLSTLRQLQLSTNSFVGRLPSSLSNMTRLNILDLSSNNLSGELPEMLFSYCSLLRFLVLSNNYLDGEIIPSNMNMSLLMVLALNNNNFVGTIKESLKISTKLEFLDVSMNKATGGLPSWIGSFSQLGTLSLARNQFHGNIPSQICKLKALRFLDLSENRFTGKIPSCGCPSTLGFFSLHGNSLTGPLPIGLQRCSRLWVLDLANNQLSGEIPRWIHVFSNLNILLLRDNQLQGELPIQLCQVQHLNIVDLSYNSISGVILPCFQNLSFGASRYDSVLDDAGLFSVQYYLPVFIFKIHTIFQEPFVASIVIFREVGFTVKSRYASYKGNILEMMSVLDLSCNQFTGGIPPELGELTVLNTLNFSHNYLSGPIPESFAKLKSIESLDLSSNHLSGSIPLQLVDLNFLEVFNVSYNNLSGAVPETGQFGSFDENNYRANPLLCGSHLPNSCAIRLKPSSSRSAESGDEGYTLFDWEVFFWSFGMSAIIVLFTFFGILYINSDWRRAWFAFIDLHLLWWLY